MDDIKCISDWIPAVTNCLIEPMKIIFNFGQQTTNNSVNNNFDIDIKVNIDDPVERNNAVGWRCGSKNTKYLTWLTGDNVAGRTRNSVS